MGEPESVGSPLRAFLWRNLLSPQQDGDDMARTKRKVKFRARSHQKHVGAARKRRLRAAGGRRTAVSRSARRRQRLARKQAR